MTHITGCWGCETMLVCPRHGGDVRAQFSAAKEPRTVCSVIRSDGKRCGCEGIGRVRHIPAKPTADLISNLGTPDHIVEHTMAMGASRCDCACGCQASTVHGTCNLCKDGAHAP